VSVAEFEARRDRHARGYRTVADELLPAFVAVDLVERGQLAKVVEELKLKDGALRHENGRARGQAGEALPPSSYITPMSRLSCRPGSWTRTAWWCRR
jgi:hypothetical protein